MTKHRSHATKKQPHHQRMHSVTHASHDTSGHAADSRVVPMRSHHPVEMPPEQADMSDFLAWPAHLFEMMLTPWWAITPVETWLENWRAESKNTFPKSQSKETEKEYLYMVELPGVTRDQVSLYFEDRTIMLRVEETEDRKKKGYAYHHERSFRRAFTLPVYTDGEAIKADMKDGVLTIIIPKTDKPVSPKAHLIEVS